MHDATAPGREAGPSWSDRLVAVAERHDRAAFVELFRHFAPRIKSHLMRRGTDPAAAEELAQEVMLTVWRRAETFDPRRAGAEAWIFAIARNRRIDRLRRERRPEIDPDDPALVPEADADAESGLATRQEAARLRSAFAGLPPEQTEVLRLAFYEEKAHAAIAAERGLPLGTVKSRLRLALARLRRELTPR